MHAICSDEIIFYMNGPMTRLLTTLAALLTLSVGMGIHAASAQMASVHSAGRGDPDRKAILDAVRTVAEHQMGKPVEFVVGDINVGNDERGTPWAFVIVNAQRPGGGAIDPYRTPFAARNGKEAVEMFDCCHVEAMLKKERGTWQVVESGVGATDLWYTEWCNRSQRKLIAICASLDE